ncbi:MAG: hypothetical protein NW206_20800 [Hyphomonadaceae bacterium]|nr:hypothetical protein [Hyphomonadaceae bacterium]
MILDTDDSFHPNGGDPHWNESTWLPIMVPEKRLSGWIYFFHRTTLGYTIGGVAAWDPSGEEMWNCRVYDWGIPYPTPPNADMYDFKLPNSLTVRTIEPMRSYQFGYDSFGCKMDLRWDATMQPHNTGFPDHSKEWGSSHFEQCGRMTGTIVLDGETLDVNCWSNRDRSWGPREVKINPRGDFPWAVASEGHSFHATAMTRLPPSNDPVDGVVDPIVAGWYLRDGELAALKEGRRSVSRAPDGRVQTVRIEAVDAMGRPLLAEGRTVNWFRWTGLPVFNYFCLTDWNLNGEQAWGEVQDFFPIPQFRQFARSRQAKQ